MARLTGHACRGLFPKLLAPGRPPRGTVPHNPVQKSFLESDVVPRLFTLEPLMPQDFLPLGQKFLVEQ